MGEHYPRTEEKGKGKKKKVERHEAGDGVTWIAADGKPGGDGFDADLLSVD
jgi:hypothetical protein